MNGKRGTLVLVSADPDLMKIAISLLVIRNLCTTTATTIELTHGVGLPPNHDHHAAKKLSPPRHCARYCSHHPSHGIALRRRLAREGGGAVFGE